MKRCVTCKAVGTVRPVREKYVDEFFLADGRALAFEFDDFPQEVCSKCGERYVAAPDMQRAEIATTRELVAQGVRDPAVFRWLRKMIRLKAAELADLLGVTPETISHWENGHSEPDRAVWSTLGELVLEHDAGSTATMDRLRKLAEAREPKRRV